MSAGISIPGFVDLQVNGYGGVDFSSPALTEESFAEARRRLRAEGTCAFLPTLVTASAEVYERNLPLLARLFRCEPDSAQPLGIHLEGPFISPEAGAVGVHDARYVREPDVGFLERLQAWADGRVRLLTMAADRPGAEALARAAAALGMTVSLGHHLATENDLARLAAVGARALTHLGNGLPNVLQRHPNPLWAGLACDGLSAMVISDGYHLPAAVIKVILRVKGIAKVIVVSDSSPIAGLPPGQYATATGTAVLEPSGLLHSPDKGCLAGSSATMLRCMNHLASLGIAGPEDLVRMGFENPLRLIGEDPARFRGVAGIAYDEKQRMFRLTR